MTESGADRARISVLVGHDVGSFVTELVEEISDRFGLVTAELQQQPATGTQPASAPTRDLFEEIRPVGPAVERES